MNQNESFAALQVRCIRFSGFEGSWMLQVQVSAKVKVAIDF
jgi:hypothetical protein